MSKQNNQAYNARVKRLTLAAKSLNPLLKRIPNPVPKPKDEEKAKIWEANWSKRVDKSTVRYFAERPEFTDFNSSNKNIDNSDKTPKDSVKI